MSNWNPYITAWLVGTTISLFIFDMMGSGDDENSKLIRSEMFVMAIFWPLIWVLVAVSLIKDIIVKK